MRLSHSTSHSGGGCKRGRPGNLALGLTYWTKRQVQGGFVVVAAVVILYVALTLLRLIPPAAPNVPWSDESWGAVVVQLTGAAGDEGIYFLPVGATVADLLRAAGVSDLHGYDEAHLALRLAKGRRLIVGPDHHLTLTRMDAAACIHFGIPLDVNTATFAQLVLVPGIGATTAERILAARTERGRFRRIEELMEVKGIKDRKLAALRRYLMVTDQPPQ